MPTITITLDDLNQLSGADFTLNELKEHLPMIGSCWESEVGNEFVLELFPNRPDMLSLEGLARAFSSFMNIKTGLRKYIAKDSKFEINVDPKVKKIRPYIVSCVVKNVEFNDRLIRSIMQLQEKLHMTHCRKRRKCAIGVYDLDQIKFPLKYTTKSKNTKFIPLDENKEFTFENTLKKTQKGKDYAGILENLKEYPCLIDSKNKILSLIPILNSNNTKITENTQNILIEATATDEKTALQALNIIATSFADHYSDLYKVKINYGNKKITTPNLEVSKIKVKLEYINKLLGMNFSKEEIKILLNKMGLGISKKSIANELEVLIPCYRTDIMHSMDVVEDIAIAYRYNNFESEPPEIATIGEENPLEVFTRNVRHLMIGQGLQEVVTFILSNKEKLFKKLNSNEEKLAEIENPKTREYCVVRNKLLPSLLEVLSNNTHNEYPQNIFEIGDIIELDSKEETMSKTVRKLAVCLSHKDTNFSEIKGILESLFLNLGLSKYSIKKLERTHYIPGRSAKLEINGKVIGEFGEIHPQVLNNWNIEMPVSSLEINFSELFKILNKD